MRIPFLVLAALTATTVFAQETKPFNQKAEAIIRDSFACSEMKITQSPWPQKLPAGFNGPVVQIESPSHSCEGQYALVFAPSGAHYLGAPWYFGDDAGETVEAKLAAFTLRAMREAFTVKVDRQKPTRDGLFPTTLYEQTERGKVALQGFVDRDGKLFFMGNFRPAGVPTGTSRMKEIEPLFATSPSRGASAANVTLVEFSDFQCPACKRTSDLGAKLADKHGDAIRYVRVDLPLMSNHPWAFSASLAGRAIYRQKPDLFWQYKKLVYENQDKLSAFTIDDFARGFAESHELDLKRYDADLASADVQGEILRGVGTAFSNDVRATPTFMVNGVIVDPGEDGAALESYIEKLVKKS